MEMPLPAPRAGVVRAVHVAEGDTVGRGDVLVELEERYAVRDRTWRQSSGRHGASPDSSS